MKFSLEKLSMYAVYQTLLPLNFFLSIAFMIQSNIAVT